MWASTSRKAVVASSAAARRLSALLTTTQQSPTTSTCSVVETATAAAASSFPARHLGCSLRYYSPTTSLFKKKKNRDWEEELFFENNKGDEDGLEYQVINNHNLSPEEIEQILAEEEAKMIQEEKDKFVADWKPGQRKRPLVYSYDLKEFQYELEPDKYPPRWTLRDKRVGALGIKVGMMPVFDEWGVRHPCTVLFLDKNTVLGHKTVEQHGYMAVQIAAGERKRKNVGKSVLGQYQNIILQSDDENPPYLVREFRVTDPAHYPAIGSRIHARHFVPGQNIDVSAISKGKGFQGAMKRHGFGGMPASHGVSLSHRALGSTGQCQDPGRVFKGKKMAGRMGHTRVTIQNLRVVKIDRGRNLLFVKGAVPGNKGEFVEIRDAIKKPLWTTDLVLDAVDRPPLPTFEYDETIDGCGEPGYDVFMPMPENDPLSPDADEAA